MANQTSDKLSDPFPASLRLAYERTRGGYERTLMAWVRTGTSLITFGFAVYKFFELEIANTETKAALIQTSLIGPREFGLVLIGIGLLTLLIGAFEHRRDLGSMRKEYPDMPRSGTQLIVVLMAFFGLLAFVAVVYRFSNKHE